jgi:DNA modification methylase
MIDYDYEPAGEQPEPVPCTVFDLFMGSGTTALVAKKLGRNYLGIELNPEYVKIAENRIKRERRM